MNILKSIWAGIMMIPIIFWFIIVLYMWYFMVWKINREDKNYCDDSCAD